VLPAPGLVAATLVSDRSILWNSLLVTLMATFEGLAMAVISGVGLAILLNLLNAKQSRQVEYSFYPFAVPVVAITPLLLIYLPQQAAVIVFAWIAALIQVLTDTTRGLNSVDRFELHGASRLGALLRLKLPSALAYMLRGLKIAGSLSLIGVVAAEIIAGSAGAGSGLAYRIAEAGYRLDIPRMFAAVIRFRPAVPGSGHSRRRLGRGRPQTRLARCGWPAATAVPPRCQMPR
jgi:NitT/TauT family transport system permease protein